MKLREPFRCFLLGRPAAFGRLCVETIKAAGFSCGAPQPPSGGCVLKQVGYPFNQKLNFQPPSGGCVLKRVQIQSMSWLNVQPPSGGCVLKPKVLETSYAATLPAAFGRLCVETLVPVYLFKRARYQPPSGGCVLKRAGRRGMGRLAVQPPSGGCVLKLRMCQTA